MVQRDPIPEAIDEAAVSRLRASWGSERPEAIEGLLPDAADSRYLASLEALVAAEMECAWDVWAGASAPAEETVAPPPSLEDYLKRFPALRESGVLARLVEHECSLRRGHGQTASADDYRRRFPDVFPCDSEAETPGGGVADSSPAGAEGPAAFEMSATGAFREPSEKTGRAAPSRTLGLGRFGAYEILEELGRGGMGVVYKARQLTADRLVALKVIRRDKLETLPRDSQTSALDRFRHEAQAAARLEHDNIVTVYEVGEIGGEQFFSMRYVEGRSLSELLREGPMEGRRCAGLLEPVARALHEAHQLGILHRDLKPANVLIDTKGDRALVADFGLAKLSEGAEELTRAGEVMGTPPYMSPEQARDSASVTALSDVYSLGATLYHMLTGRPPFQAATPIETLRQVMDEDPAPPRQLNPAIDLDLETICLKCLLKEPPRRYGSCQDLADDLKRYLSHEPILARPIGTFGRLARWCRRNPLAAGLSGAAAVLFVALFVAILVGYFQTSAALRVAEDRYRQAREVVNQFFTRVSEDTLLNQPGMQPLRRDLLEMALDSYKQFLQERADDPTVRDELGSTYYRVGRITEAIDSPEAALGYYRRAREIQEELVAERPDAERLKALGLTLNATGRALTRQRAIDKAREVHGQAAAVRERLVRDFPDLGEPKRLLANSLMNLGILDHEARRPDDARPLFQRAQTLRREAVAGGYDTPQLQRDLGMGHYYLALAAWAEGAKKEAEASFREAIAVFEELLEGEPHDLANQNSLVACYRMLADLIWADDWDSASRLYQEAIRRMERLAWANPDVPEYQVDLAGLYSNFGESHRQRNELSAALRAYQQARDILQGLVEKYPDSSRYRWDLAKTLHQAGVVQWLLDQRDDARHDFQSAADHLDLLIGQSPEAPKYAAELGEICGKLGALSAQLEDRDAARGFYGRAREILEDLVEEHPETMPYRQVCVRALLGLAALEAGESVTTEHLKAAREHLLVLLEQTPQGTARDRIEQTLREVKRTLEGPTKPPLPSETGPR